jgi:trk system potassium uptake protein TrkH
MAVLSTSGISPDGGIAGSSAGLIGEMMIFVLLFAAVSRATFSARVRRAREDWPWRDPEIRIAAFLLVIVPGLLFLRHWAGAWEVAVVSEFGAAVRALWGSAFTVLSFLTTTGFVSADWDTARAWSALETPGIVLLGLALIGGGVGTTAGGVKLLRVYALYKHGQRELDRLVYPHSVGGAGREARRIRGQGAYVSWIFFMLFALSLAVVAGLMALAGAGFDAAVILAVASLANCGPLAGVVLSAPLAFADLGDVGKVIAALAMALGRLETLAILALLNPGFWRL